MLGLHACVPYTPINRVHIGASLMFTFMDRRCLFTCYWLIDWCPRPF